MGSLVAEALVLDALAVGRGKTSQALTRGSAGSVLLEALLGETSREGNVGSEERGGEG